MRDIDVDTDAFELLPADLQRLDQNRRGYNELNAGDAAQKTKVAPRVWAMPGVKHLLYSLPLIASIVPITLLLAYSTTLSTHLGYNGCTPSGEFTLPYTSSIWDPRRFFTITVAFSGPGLDTCEYGPGDSASLACNGYSFTIVKVIDIAWDVLVGRGGQAVLALVAYRVFCRVVKLLMSEGEVGYDMFTTLAFDVGSSSSFVTLIRHAVGWTPIPRTRHAILAYWGMALATLYIVVAPSLLAAMTGYTSYYAPFIDINPDAGSSKSSIKDCSGTITPVWGRVGLFEVEKVEWDGRKEEFWNEPVLPVSGSFPLLYDHPPYYYFIYGTLGPEWIDYYYRYQDVYSECASQLNISNCKAANIRTFVIADYPYLKYNDTVHNPMPGILPYGNGSSSVSKYTHWLCGDQVIELSELLQYAGEGSKKGLCRAGSGYVWGFSFLLTFVTCVLNLIFVIIMYALWIDVRRHHWDSSEVGQLKDAVAMVTQAQHQYGPKIGGWSSATLQRKVVKGKSGMTFAQDESLRKRKNTSLPEHEHDDPYDGNWGGEVEFAERQ